MRSLVSLIRFSCAESGKRRDIRDALACVGCHSRVVLYARCVLVYSKIRK